MPIGSGIRGATNNIVAGMMAEHKRREAYREELGTINALRGLVNDKKTLKQIDDALAQYGQYRRENAAASTGALNALNRVLMYQLQQQAQEVPRRPVTIGGQIYNLTEAGAASYAAQQEQAKAAVEAAKPRETRAQRRMTLSEEAGKRAGEEAERSEARLGLETSREKRAELEKRPEIEFSRKYGLTPQSVIGLQEASYVPKDVHGKPVNVRDPQGNFVPLTLSPLQPGETEPIFTQENSIPGKFMNFLKEQLGYPAESTPQSVRWTPSRPDMIFRENKNLFKGKTGQGPAEQVSWDPNPAGQYFNVRGQHIPIEDLSRVQNQANAVQQETKSALNTINAMQIIDPDTKVKRPLTEEEKLGKRMLLRDRLNTLGYNPADKFWGLPEEQ